MDVDQDAFNSFTFTINGSAGGNPEIGLYNESGNIPFPTGSFNERYLIDGSGPANANNFVDAASNITDETQPQIINGSFNGSAMSLFENGSLLGTDTTVNTPLNLDPLSDVVIGGGVGINGEIAEVIVFNNDKGTGTERQQIQSYLAIKYGITLNSGTVAYTSSTGTDVWTVDATYFEDIFGIAKDNTSSLDQQISKSVNEGAILTVSTDTDFTGANGTHSSLTDGQFLVIGNDGGDPSMRTSLYRS